MAPTLFLDFDGVLHPYDVYLVNGKAVRPGGGLFVYAPLVVAALAPYPTVKIVLSTSWVSAIGFEESRSRLPVELQRRVVGATDQATARTRHSQIAHYVRQHGLISWLAVDDDTEGWPAEQRKNLVRTPRAMGLSYLDAQLELADKLALLTTQD